MSNWKHKNHGRLMCDCGSTLFTISKLKTEFKACCVTCNKIVAFKRDETIFSSEWKLTDGRIVNKIYRTKDAFPVVECKVSTTEHDSDVV